MRGWGGLRSPGAAAGPGPGPGLGEDFWCFLFQLTVRVFDRGTNKELDDPLPFNIIIDDMNDNAPTFAGPLQVTVPEKSKAGEEGAATGGRGWGGAPESWS